MLRFRREVFQLGMLFLVLAGMSAALIPTLTSFADKAQVQPLDHFGSVVGTFVLVILAAIVPRNLPNYGGAPPLQDLLAILAPIVGTGLLASGWFWSITVFLAGEIGASSPTVLQVCRVLDAGTLLWCAGLTWAITVEFSTNRAWERRNYSRS